MSTINIDDIQEKGYEIVHGEVVPQRWTCDLWSYSGAGWTSRAAHLRTSFEDCFKNNIKIQCTYFPTHFRLELLFRKVVV